MEDRERRRGKGDRRGKVGEGRVGDRIMEGES